MYSNLLFPVLSLSLTPAYDTGGPIDRRVNMLTFPDTKPIVTISLASLKVYVLVVLQCDINFFRTRDLTSIATKTFDHT